MSDYQEKLGKIRPGKMDPHQITVATVLTNQPQYLGGSPWVRDVSSRAVTDTAPALHNNSARIA